MNCQEALSLLYDILDKEADEIDVAEVKDHISRCSDCGNIYRLEEALQRFLDEKLTVQKNDNPSGLENLKQRVATELDRQDRQAVTKVARRPFDLAARTLALAASLVLLLTATFYLSGWYKHHRDYHALESIHEQAVLDLSGYANDNHTSTARAMLAEEFAYELRDAVGDYRLIGGEIVDIDDVSTCHFVYTSQDNVVSVFVCNCSARDIPEDAKSNGFKTADMVLYDLVCPGCRLCYHQLGRALIVTASSDTTVDLHQFIPGKSIPQLTLF